MDEASQFFKVCGTENAVLDLIFIHGLTGNPTETWTTDPGNEYWPTWFCEVFGNVAIYAIGYPASVYAKWASKELDLHERTNNLLERLASYGIGKRPIMVVAHSLRALILERQKLPRHAELDAVALGVTLAHDVHVEVASPMMPSPNSSSISTFKAGPLTRISSYSR